MPEYRLLIQTGYVENCSNAAVDVALSSKNKLTPTELVQKFIADWIQTTKSYLQDSLKGREKSCCQQADDKAKFCPECGRAIQKDVEAEEELKAEAADKFVDFITGNAESFDHQFLELMQQLGWDVWPSPAGKYTLIHIQRMEDLIREDYEIKTFIAGVYQVSSKALEETQ